MNFTEAFSPIRAKGFSGIYKIVLKVGILRTHFALSYSEKKQKNEFFHKNLNVKFMIIIIKG